MKDGGEGADVRDKRTCFTDLVLREEDKDTDPLASLLFIRPRPRKPLPGITSFDLYGSPL